MSQVTKISDEIMSVDFSGSFSDAVLSEALQFSLRENNASWWKNSVDFFNGFLSSRSLEVRTSGSTGVPKKMSFEEGHVKFSASLTIDTFSLRPGDQVFCALSSDFVAGKMMWMRAYYGKLVLWLRKPNANVLEGVPTNVAFRFTPLVPYQLFSTLQQKGSDISRLGILLLGGAAISKELLVKIKELEQDVFQSFGMSETLTHIAIRSLSVEESSYQAVGDYTFSVGDDDELVIFQDDYFSEGLVTNDIVQLHSTTNFDWKGRGDNVLNSAGIKFHPEELEAKIKEVLPNLSFVISSLPDVDFGDRLVLVSESRPMAGIDKDRLKEVLSKFEYPTDYFVLDAFPRTYNGKLKRQKIRELIAQLPNAI